MTGKKIYIKAYLNHNLGDDLFVDVLAKRYPETRFYLYAPPGYRRTFARLGNVKVYETSMLCVRLYNKIFRMLGFARDSFDYLLKKSCCAVVQLGGSIFRTSDKMYRQNLEKMLRLIHGGKKVFVIGSNFCKGFDEKFRRDHYEYFKQAEDVCFRDSYSCQLFRSLKNVRWADDVIFGCKEQPGGKEENAVLLSVIDFKVRPAHRKLHNAYRDKMAELTNLFASKGFQVKLASFCEMEGDEDMAEKIAACPGLSKEAKDRLQIVRYRNDMGEMLQAVKSAKYIVAARFHAMILGLLFGKKVFAVIQGNKFSNVIADNGWPLGSCHIREIEKLDPEQLFRYFENVEAIDIRNCIHGAEKQFSALDRYIAGETL